MTHTGPNEFRSISLQQILAETQLFTELNEEALKQISSVATVRTVNRGAIVFHEGDSAGAFFVVGSGKVKICKLSSDGKEQILMIAGPGDTFAEAAMFSGSKYPATALTIEPTQLAMFNRDRFVALLAKNPDLSLNLIARLSSLLRMMTKLVERLSLADVTTRLAKHLVDTAPESALDGFEIHLPEKKAVLASQLGTIPETLSRSLSRLVKQGIISIDGPDIELINLSRLRELAGRE